MSGGKEILLIFAKNEIKHNEPQYYSMKNHQEFKEAEKINNLFTVRADFIFGKN